jgi:hypothetical protein
MDGDDCGAINVMNEWQAQLKYSKKSCLSAALFTTNPAHEFTGLEPEPPRCEGRY